MNEQKQLTYRGGVKRCNTFDLQLFGNVSNPYTFTLDGNYVISSDIE